MEVTLQDLLTLDPYEILKKINRDLEEPIQPAVAPSSQTSTAPITERSLAPKSASGSPKDRYRKAFPPGTVFAKGTVFEFGDHSLEVLNVEKGSRRIRFIRTDTQEIFSLPESVLTGEEEVFPFVKGDIISFEDQTYEVIGLNPASKNIVIFYDGKPRYVKITKVVKVTSEGV